MIFTQYTSRQKAECAEREVKKRKEMYNNLVRMGRMDPKTADYQVAVMQEIADEYGHKAELEDPRYQRALP